MSKRLTYDEVLNYVNNISGGKTKLLSKKYINNRSPLLFQCACGETFERNFVNFRKGNMLCPKCCNEEVHKKARLDLDYIKSEINKSGCRYISGEYKNKDSKLYLQCTCGNYFYKSWDTFKRGQSHCPDCGRKKIAEFQRKYYLNDAQTILSQHGYKIIGNYVDSVTPVECICTKGHVCLIKLSDLIGTRHSGCKQCGIERRSGVNHYNYKGGVSLLDNVIRQNLSDWNNNIRKLYNHECPIMHTTKLNTVVHHLYSLNMIIQDVLREDKVQIQLFKPMNEIELYDKEIKKIISDVVNKHTNKTGILIDKDIHSAFHKQYGYGNNTPKQFDDFLKNNYSISLSQILKE